MQDIAVINKFQWSMISSISIWNIWVGFWSKQETTQKISFKRKLKNKIYNLIKKNAYRSKCLGTHMDRGGSKVQITLSAEPISCIYIEKFI